MPEPGQVVQKIASGGWGKGKRDNPFQRVSFFPFPFPQTPNPISLPKLFICAFARIVGSGKLCDLFFTLGV